MRQAGPGGKTDEGGSRGVDSDIAVPRGAI